MTNLTENDLMVMEREDTTNNLYLAFVIEDEHFAVEVSNVKEIVGVMPITKIPKTDEFIKGIINLRGDIVPVIDVRLRFRKPEIEYNERTCFVVVFYQDYILGLIVDDILGVYPIGNDLISAPPSARLNYANQFVRNIGRADDGVKLLLDLERLIF